MTVDAAGRLTTAPPAGVATAAAGRAADTTGRDAATVGGRAIGMEGSDISLLSTRSPLAVRADR